MSATISFQVTVREGPLYDVLVGLEKGRHRSATIKRLATERLLQGDSEAAATTTAQRPKRADIGSGDSNPQLAMFVKNLG